MATRKKKVQQDIPLNVIPVEEVHEMAFKRINNIMRVAAIIYNATVNEEKMWQGKLCDALYFHVKQDDIIDAVDFLSEDEMIIKQYGDDGYGNQVVLLTMHPYRMHDFMHLLLDIQPKYRDVKKSDHTVVKKIVDKIVGMFARMRDKMNFRGEND